MGVQISFMQLFQLVLITKRAQGLQQDQCIAILLISIARKFTVQKSSFLLSGYVTFANLVYMSSCSHSYASMYTYSVYQKKIALTNFTPALCLKQFSHCSLMCPKKGIIAGEQGTNSKDIKSLSQAKGNRRCLVGGWILACNEFQSKLPGKKRNKLVSKACILCQIYKDAQSYGIKPDMQVARTDFRSKAEVVICSHKSPEL